MLLKLLDIRHAYLMVATHRLVKLYTKALMTTRLGPSAANWVVPAHYKAHTRVSECPHTLQIRL